MAKPTVIIIAGGANSRFFPFQTLGHKGAFPLLGKSLLARTLENLHAHGFEKVVTVLTPRDAELHITEQIVQHTQLPLQVSYVTQPEPRGMGDATLLGTRTMSAEEQARFAVISAYQINAGEMLDQMMTLGEGTVLASARTSTPTEYGMLAFNDAGQVVNIVEKPAVGTEPSDQKILTIYLFAQSFLEQLKSTPAAEYNFETALGLQLQRQPAPVLKLTTEPPSLKYPWQLFTFLELLFKQQQPYRAASAQLAPTAVIDESAGPVYIGENAKIGHASRIVGPCYIGDNVVVGDFVLVRQSSLEKNVEVGGFLEIARSIISTGTHLHSGYVGDSIIGPNVRIGAGFVNANKRIDRKSIGVKVKGKMIDSGRIQLGMLVGENAKIGVHVSVMPGKCIGQDAVVYPHQSVADNVTAELQPSK